MTDRKHAIELGDYFDGLSAENAALKAEIADLRRDLHETRGREKMLVEINGSLLERMAKRDTEIALLRGADSVHEKPVVPQITHDDQAKTLSEKLAEIEPEPMPQFMRNAQIPKPKVADRRVPRQVA